MGAALDQHQRQEIYTDFNRLVNLAPKELEDWLETPESREVGSTPEGGGESVGHASGRRIVAIKRTKKDELDDDDYEHMRRVIGYIRRHTAQGPSTSDPQDSRWRYSLLNWGHDPLKD